ncbi:TetR/AcrR family transcriptional regulator [Streptomyces sp. NPDC052023]|uniref:TetR/AcrR family transcriptional regulator n=1 Tax=Streptomyces sp. NPDC052023 TaxID=3365681 RepID=UPI0037CF53E7
MSGLSDSPSIYGVKRPTLRRDASRNARRILDAGREALRENPHASAEDIAKAAGLGIATLYRRFPTRDDLVRGVIWDIFATDVAPALARAEGERDPRTGLRIAFQAVMRTSAHERIDFPVGMTLEIAQSFLGPTSRLIQRGQEQGLLRPDLDPEKDTLRLLLMLLSVLPTFSHQSGGWNRYLELVMEALTLTPMEPLPPAEPIIDPFKHA